MRLRNLILMVLAVMCTSQVMAQSKRNVRKRPAKRTVVNNTKKPVDKTKDAKLPVDSQAVAPAAQTTAVPAAAVPAAAAPAGSTEHLLLLLRQQLRQPLQQLQQRHQQLLPMQRVRLHCCHRQLLLFLRTVWTPSTTTRIGR